MSNQQQQNLQPNLRVLDYVLRERIGAGGYGEVWSAEAPGGMLKAIKFVFGFHDEKRAQRELKALDRIKHIRHPFLLSLERIDVIDGRLVVIAELAEMCLKTRFNQCVDGGMVGIDRDELIGYMRESADALDYIANSFNLAHLDIKPENLLLVGGHAKVADFGLVKDLQAVNQSLMDGLTPAYAGPELFDGQPGRASDQYSLAIVYQEMLTGTRPFSGTTAAQLANQHLHSRPNLNDLPRSDQGVVARALAKQADKRFPDCRAFVEDLAKRRNRVRRKSTDSTQSRLGEVNTQEITNADLDIQAIKPDVTLTISESFVPAIKFEADVEKLEPFKLDESQAEIRPTLYIGVGQTGAQILCKLKRRITNRYGSQDKTPALRMLYLDVDRRSLFEATMGNDGESLQNHECLGIPLRKPEEYRNDKELDVSWIGRRWIYNIPKSQLTESLRPLGRLAYVDHHEEIYRRIGDELAKVAEMENVATTAETTGLMPSTMTPQVIFVGSVAGGIGSGMLLDLAFTVRVCMGEMGLTDDHLYGLFTHSTCRKAGDHRLAIANSYSFLGEMYHYNLNGYPGNEACRVPAFGDESPVFDGTYFVHLGDDLTTGDYSRSVDGLAEYLFTSTCTRCNAFFDLCRDSEEFEAGMLKTLGISFIGRGENALSDSPSDKLVERLLASWLDARETNDPEQQPAPIAKTFFDQTILSGKKLDDQITSIVKEQLTNDPVNQLLRQVNEKLGHVQSQQVTGMLSVARKMLEERFGSANTDVKLDTMMKREQTLCEIIDARISAIARRAGEELSESVLRLIDDTRFRVFGARAVAESICDEMQVVELGLETRLASLQEKVDRCEACFREELNQKNKDVTVDPAALFMQYVARLVDNRLQIVIDTYKRKLVLLARNELTMTIKRIGEHHQMLDLVRHQIKLPIVVHDMLEQPVEKVPTLFHLLEEYGTELCAGLPPVLEARLEKQILQPEGGLRNILGEGGARVRLLPALIKREAHFLVCQQLQELRLDSMMVESNLPADTIATWIRQMVHPAMPFLFKCGGTSRLLLTVPQNAPVASIASFIQNQMDYEANVIPSTCGEFIICTEMDQMPAENVAMTLLQMQPDCAELIERLHCRNDVDWTSLTPMC